MRVSSGHTLSLQLRGVGVPCHPTSGPLITIHFTHPDTSKDLSGRYCIEQSIVVKLRTFDWRRVPPHICYRTLFRYLLDCDVRICLNIATCAIRRMTELFKKIMANAVFTETLENLQTFNLLCGLIPYQLPSIYRRTFRKCSYSFCNTRLCRVDDWLYTGGNLGVTSHLILSPDEASRANFRNLVVKNTWMMDRVQNIYLFV
jgi:hypothetical protein